MLADEEKTNCRPRSVERGMVYCRHGLIFSVFQLTSQETTRLGIAIWSDPVGRIAVEEIDGLPSDFA